VTTRRSILITYVFTFSVFLWEMSNRKKSRIETVLDKMDKMDKIEDAAAEWEAKRNEYIDVLKEMRDMSARFSKFLVLIERKSLS